MIEVTIKFEAENGTGLETYTVNIEPPRGAFSSAPYGVAIRRALDAFECRYLKAVPSMITTRDVPAKADVLEVKWPK